MEIRLTLCFFRQDPVKLMRLQAGGRSAAHVYGFQRPSAHPLRHPRKLGAEGIDIAVRLFLPLSHRVGGEGAVEAGGGTEGDAYVKAPAPLQIQSLKGLVFAGRSPDAEGILLFAQEIALPEVPAYLIRGDSLLQFRQRELRRPDAGQSPPGQRPPVLFTEGEVQSALQRIFSPEALRVARGAETSGPLRPVSAADREGQRIGAADCILRRLRRNFCFFFRIRFCGSRAKNDHGIFVRLVGIALSRIKCHEQFAHVLLERDSVKQ